MNDNTILRIKVPANLYESVKKQLTLNEAKKAGHNYGAGMEVVKEKKIKTPKNEMQKVEEMKPASSNPSDMGIDIVDAPGGIVNKEAKSSRSLEELMKAKKKLESKINEMEKTPKDKVNEAGAGVEYAWIPGAIAAGLIAANVVKAVRAHMKEKNLSGLKGFWQAYQEIGKDASKAIDKSMGGNIEEAKEEEEKKEEDK
jgi:Flp pilus assembly pilin Flp